MLAELKREMGPIAFSAQYQQSPIPPGGTIIKRKWLTPYDDVDHQPGDRIITSWDIALSETESGDYSACVVLLQRGEVFYILEVVRGRFPFDALKRKVMEVKQRYGSCRTRSGPTQRHCGTSLLCTERWHSGHRSWWDL